MTRYQTRASALLLCLISAISSALCAVSCTLTADTESLSNGQCPSDEKACDGQCVPLSPANGCGAASCSPCSVAHAEASCKADGKCGILKCAARFQDCDRVDTNGCEADFDYGVNTCNGCDTKCPIPENGVPACDKGFCTLASCDSGFKDCDESSTNGCETSIFDDSSNCGKCGTICVVGTSCTGGMCKAPP